MSYPLLCGFHNSTAWMNELETGQPVSQRPVRMFFEQGRVDSTLGQSEFNKSNVAYNQTVMVTPKVSSRNAMTSTRPVEPT
jgi:hypothetical protein